MDSSEPRIPVATPETPAPSEDAPQEEKVEEAQEKPKPAPAIPAVKALPTPLEEAASLEKPDEAKIVERETEIRAKPRLDALARGGVGATDDRATLVLDEVRRQVKLDVKLARRCGDYGRAHQAPSDLTMRAVARVLRANQVRPDGGAPVVSDAAIAKAFEDERTAKAEGPKPAKADPEPKAEKPVDFIALCKKSASWANDNRDLTEIQRTKAWNAFVTENNGKAVRAALKVDEVRVHQRYTNNGSLVADGLDVTASASTTYAVNLHFTDPEDVARLEKVKKGASITVEGRVAYVNGYWLPSVEAPHIAK